MKKIKISKRLTVSAGIIPVKIFKGKYKFLLLRSGNYWDFPKGRVEKDEDLIDTAIRETQEETNIGPESLYFKWGHKQKRSDLYKKKSKVAVYFIAETDSDRVSLPVSEELGRPEHDEFRWVDYNDATSLVNERISKILDWANEIINAKS